MFESKYDAYDRYFGLRLFVLLWLIEWLYLHNFQFQS